LKITEYTDKVSQGMINFIGGISILLCLFIAVQSKNRAKELKSQIEDQASTHLEMIEAQQQDIAELRETLELLRPRVR